MSQFLQQFNGSLVGLTRWSDWDEMLQRLHSANDSTWYVYYVGEAVPTEPMSTQQFAHFLIEIEVLLRQDHQEAYLGIIYTDNKPTPNFLKIYDPNNLGASCGSSGMRVLPGWTISRALPVDLQAEFPNPGGRRRWWQRVFNNEVSTKKESATVSA